MVHFLGEAAGLSLFSGTVSVAAGDTASGDKGVASRIDLFKADELLQQACDIAVNKLVDIEAVSIAAILYTAFQSLRQTMMRL